MQGIHFITDRAQEKVAVMIDLKEYGAIWEDFEDVLIASQRAEEDTIPLDQLKAKLSEEGHL